jgi:zinc D-Ala-D-Ala dipeptidase
MTGSRRSRWFIVAAAAAVACAAPTTHAQQVPPAGFTDAQYAVPGLAVDMRYHGSDNFVGRPVDGYEAPVCILTDRAASALRDVQAELQPFGLGLKAFDCYRPARAVAHFVRWARDPADTLRKADYYPDIDKAQLFALGYIAERSGHSRGSTVDLTIVDLASGVELDMGGAWDLFSTTSWPMDTSATAAQRANRLLLRALMIRHGFRPYDQEWWHFTLVDEPHPDRYFDFPVRPLSCPVPEGGGAP